MIPSRTTRTIRIADLRVGGDAPIAVQSMAATRTRDVEATLEQVRLLEEAGADLVRIAVDSKADVDALAEIRAKTRARLSVDLQESYRLAEVVAPHVDKIRYNPGHLHHHEKDKPTEEKVAYLVDIARSHGCAMRIGVNAGSIAPEYKERFGERPRRRHRRMCASTTAPRRRLGFTTTSSRSRTPTPRLVIEANHALRRGPPGRAAAPGRDRGRHAARGHHQDAHRLRAAPVSRGIGDTLRVSLTVPVRGQGSGDRVGRTRSSTTSRNGRFRSVPPNFFDGLNIIACPSCSRVENERFIELAEDVKQMTEYAAEHDLTIAVMGCRVNGPGETDDADLGLWCGPTHVNLKRGEESVGSYPYDEILGALRTELDALVAGRARA